ncbi:dehydratase [Rhodococcus sp. 05-340-1]|uniref:MaoC family dehydratase n=1 Tax=unclassified Rhodococcus (in: high G+C Gram-positive bacteria) TaxID=192944 RepID=UPI000B9ABFCF|nr:MULTISPECIES: MaoC family dehydratase [unclassified Rhodococcus (in: high G+C Gram-positive bacteria)]OZD71120.1 dehydratase [Rhodococcus sp. 05-340-2]OZD74073.1 dehydratase [Rhodococcus sp. 05-340-1]
MKIFEGLHELKDAAGCDLGTTDWLVVDQERVDLFADATGDHQWIHVDPERAASGPFGGAIAHGLLTLSLLPLFLNQLYRVDNISMAVNYGMNKVRFPSPVRVGARLSASARIDSVQSLEGAVQAVFVTTMNVEGATKPASVIESVVRYIG